MNGLQLRKNYDTFTLWAIKKQLQTVRPVSFVLEWLWQWVVEWEKQDAEKQLEQHTTHTIKNGRVFTRIIMGEGELMKVKKGNREEVGKQTKKTSLVN